jgi:hypothetical protein
MIVLVMTILSGLFLRDDELLNQNRKKKNHQHNRMLKRINQVENFQKAMNHQEVVGPYKWRTT